MNTTVPGAPGALNPPTPAKPQHRPHRTRELLTLFKEAAKSWDKDNASRLAAALACYTLLSMAPLVVLCVAIASLAFGREAAEGRIAGELGSLVGIEGANAIQSVIKNAKDPGSGILATVGGVTVLLFGASGVFGELQSSLNTVWEVQSKPGRGIWQIVKDRFFSFTMVLGVGFLLLVSLVVSAGLAALGTYAERALPLPWLWQILNQVISIGVTALIFAMIFKVIPDVLVSWRDVWMGALVTALLFSLGRFLLALYLGRSGVASSYGAAGSVVALVLWTYYSAQIFLFGAEFTEAYAAHHGSRIEPSDNAVPLVPAAAEARDGAEARKGS